MHMLGDSASAKATARGSSRQDGCFRNGTVGSRMDMRIPRQAMRNRQRRVLHDERQPTTHDEGTHETRWKFGAVGADCLRR